MKLKIAVISAAILFFASVSAVPAQPWKGWRGSEGWGMGGQYQRMFDPAKVEKISGEVAGIEQVTPMRGMHYGVVLMVKTEKETVPVHLGPSWYIERLDTKFNTGDKVEVTGARTTFQGKPAIIAAEIRKDDQVLVLRDRNGVPVWAGWGRRR
ncbi:MAG: DNA-binding protein [Syntrophales bacterium]|nr:DNA-binding protein [Syntrophales bacterium]